MPPDFLHPDREIQKHGDSLPHWQQGDALQFVTFRLADSLPWSLVREWKDLRRQWTANHPKPWDELTEREYHSNFTWKIEGWLDSGMGSCLLGEKGTREPLIESIMRYQGERVIHEAWVIMPNHVHLLFKPLIPLPDLIEAWKSVSARAIGRGPIWQRNYRDTMIRDIDHFNNAVRYIRNNPVKAKLADESFTLWEGERAMRIS
ncbi:MAG: hypothetical protein EOP85_06790 [Verrucomicrobiaceae bacterium]|nr:MAG: hypothetical protein EOP85_06790 [Verrucomicrobiaceae bacterium]